MNTYIRICAVCLVLTYVVVCKMCVCEVVFHKTTCLFVYMQMPFLYLLIFWFSFFSFNNFFCWFLLCRYFVSIGWLGVCVGFTKFIQCYIQKNSFLYIFFILVPFSLMELDIHCIVTSKQYSFNNFFFERTVAVGTMCVWSDNSIFNRFWKSHFNFIYFVYFLRTSYHEQIKHFCLNGDFEPGWVRLCLFPYQHFFLNARRAIQYCLWLSRMN